MFSFFLFFASVLLIEAQDNNIYHGYDNTIYDGLNHYADFFDQHGDNLDVADLLAPYQMFLDDIDDDLEYEPGYAELIDSVNIMESHLKTRQRRDADPIDAAPFGIFDGIIKKQICKRVGPKLCKLLDPVFPCMLDNMDLMMELKDVASQGKLALLNFTLSPEMYEALSPCLGNCMRDVYRLVMDVKYKQSYAIHALDSLGKPPSGILGGNVQWLGDMTECLNVHAPYRNDTNSPELYNEFSGRYCTTKLATHGKQEKKVRIGFCLPNTCHTHDIPEFLTFVLTKVKTNVTIEEARCPEEIPYSHMDYVTIILCAVIGALVLAGTLVDAFRRLFDTGEDDVIVEEAKTLETTAGNNSINTIYQPEHMTSDPDAILVEHDTVEMQVQGERALDAHVRHVEARLNGSPEQETPAWQEEYKRARDGAPRCDVKGLAKSCLNVFTDLLMAFSCIANTERLLDSSTKSTSTYACAVDGIRVLTSGWVVLGHTFVMIVVYLANSMDFMAEIKTFWFQPIVNTALAADAFFVLGGFLVAYLTLSKLKKERFLGVNWVGFYLHRLWRITPTYMFILLFWSTLFVHLPEGPLAGTVQDIPRYNSCAQYWWTNLLYIHNFVPGNPSEACMGWTWYLADDMQFFILSPIFIIGLYKFWKVFVPLMMAIVSACVIATGLYARYLERDWINPLANMGQIIQGGVLDEDWSRMFVRPYHRVAPYLMGMIAGYVAYRFNAVDMKRAKWWKKLLAVCFWVVVFLLCSMCVYGMTGHYEFQGQFPINMSATYLSTSRFVFATCLAAILLACNLGIGGPVNWFLSWNVFRPLGRLSFIVFIVHPIIIQVTYKSRQIPYYFTESDMTYIFLGNLVLSYLVALLIHLAIEAPCAALERIIRKYWNRRTSSSDTERKRCCC